ncbi:membrane alanyl aminopeptidase-like [Pectinophora gossypiella]|uniref:membrane alanyl aminopeptidase-like n=1 Tax=Pectinophora gossypiella TaxID=13191 RepID=UPI00214F1550|nr:membrane alanyl aminopeptidase-like [Pectinophora gossypiella]XP_049870010.1 membrane alanyl aminopeptidase-like [Pectinophora gossypiella]
MFLKVALALCLVTSTTAFFIEEECLNYTVYPVQYELTIIPYVLYEGRSYYDCETIITVIANAPNVQIIELDAKDLDIKTVNVYYNDRDIINKFRPFEYNGKVGKLYIYLREALQQYSISKIQYNIKISFSKQVESDSSSGIFIAPYEDGGTKHLFATRLSPNKARYFFPCFENPRFEAVFKFRVYQVPNRKGVQYANTSLVIAKEQTRHKVRDDYVIIEYIPSSQVALHQVGFHYSQFGFRQVSAKNTNDTIIVWGPNNKLKYYDFILIFGEKIMNMIHEYASVNRPLVYGPINIVAVPLRLDGYEVGSWNLLTNRENRLTYIPEFTSIKQEEHMTFELAQQLCRIWLGNPGEIERTRWYEEWFKEGVSTYLAYYFLTQYEQGIQTLRHRIPIGIHGLQMKNIAMSQDWHHSTPALITFNRTLAVEIPARYKELVQMKTASILWMIENWIGSDKFHMALVRYINTRRGHYISLKDFMTNLDHDTVECLHQFFNGSTASKVLDSWFHQPGYPVIHVNVLRDRTPNAVQLKQHKFSFVREDRDSHYLIPISYMVQNNQNCFNCYQPRFTIDQTYTFEENLNGGWIILNTNASGYYRVNYDTFTWKLIAKTLKEAHLSINELNRAQMVNDVFALYAAGVMNQSLAVEILDYLDQELSPVVWDSAISGFDLIKTPGASCNINKYLYKDWQEFMQAKVAPMYNQIATEIEQQSVSRMFRSHIISFACAVDLQPCLNQLRQSYDNYIHRKHRLDPDTRETCYEVLYRSDANFGRQGFNAFEVEDKVSAERKIRKEKQFLYQIPMGSPVLDRLVMSTTNAPDSTTEKKEDTEQPTVPATHGGATQNFAPNVLALLFFILCSMR